ncbi:multi-component regulatory system-3 [Mangrovactinospora gilvigrisea]|uniref:Multi-component regulatory system-3 n=1 Tax=Mangrovactinospora gilvigrisea TaxID=1428644 RepID=A0A1J7BI09_9ACTN|nr:DUF742 domain-containing protein [Mangrovactinospora gilvigrisea]OIV38286.1 multi-component regulatory system-3 [Mangrovactinospora gilvigrisea]
MTAPDNDPWVDDDAGRLVRPYAISNGRTRPATRLDLITLVMATGSSPRGVDLGPDHNSALRLCRGPMSVAEIAAHLRLPAVVAKVLLADLVECGALIARAPELVTATPVNRPVLEAVLDGLRRRL